MTYRAFSQLRVIGFVTWPSDKANNSSIHNHRNIRVHTYKKWKLHSYIHCIVTVTVTYIHIHTFRDAYDSWTIGASSDNIPYTAKFLIGKNFCGLCIK